MSSYDDITEGLKKIHDSVYVSGTKRTSSYKSGHTNDGEYPRVKAYLDGGAVPSPWPTTLMGQGLSLVERGRRTLAPPQVGYEIETWEPHANPNYRVNGYENLNQVFRFSHSATTPTDHWGGIPTREFKLGMTPPDSYEWWMLYEVWIDPSWPSGSGAYMTGPEGHTAPGDPSWTGNPEWDAIDARMGVAPFHFKFYGNALQIQHEPNIDNGVWQWVILQNPQRGAWHSVCAQMIFGRHDLAGTIPGHPNNGVGRSRVWVDGNNTPVDTGNIDNMWRSEANPALLTTRSILSEGIYCNSQETQPLIARMTVSRWGRTLAAALGDSEVTVESQTQVSDTIQDPGEPDIGPSYWQPITPRRRSDDFILPSSLGG